MKKPSDVFNSIRFAKMDPKHDKGHKGGSTDDEEHYAVGEKEWNQQVAHAKKRAMQEAKEKTEYDYEGDMARGQLQSIINNAQRVHDMLEDNDNLPEWVQSKITLAEDYISTVANYMMSEIDEEVQTVDEGIVGNMVSKVINKLHSSNAKRPLPQASDRREYEKPKTEAKENPPFDPPYKTNKGVVTDKSGAKHGPMSMARNLAKQAMKKQAEKMPVKESLEESRKTDIVKEAFKKAKKKNDDTFQSEPELGSSVVKADN